MKLMKLWFSAKELMGQKGLPSSVQGILRRSKREFWRFRPRKGRGGGKEFFISSLPLKTRLALISQQLCFWGGRGVKR